jgi:hypothetical protein
MVKSEAPQLQSNTFLDVGNVRLIFGRGPLKHCDCDYWCQQLAAAAINLYCYSSF